MKIIKFLFFLAILLVGAFFTVLNAGQVQVDYYFGVIDLPLSLVLVAALAVGAVLGVLASSTAILRLKAENAGLKRRVALANEEVNNLRTIPVREH